MHQTGLHRTLGGFAVLLAIIACALPTQTIQHTPGTAPSVAETATVSTLESEAQPTEQATQIAVTATAVATETIPPTPKISSAGTSLLSLADGSTQFTDHTAGIQILFSPIWLVFRVGEPEYYQAWEKHGAQNLAAIDALSAMQNLDPKVLRVVALDLRPEHMPDEMLTALSVIYLAGDLQDLKEREKVRRNQHSPCAGYQFISSNYPQTNNGIQTLVMDESCKATDERTILYRDIYFHVPSGMIHINFETNFDYRDTPLLEFEQVLNNITLLNP
ncbi:MAG TPA: hypothetical protein VFY66_20185 [Anaerolineales bacterium]|nr:hypothetical protein [Anaerolineales bacterium]